MPNHCLHDSNLAQQLKDLEKLKEYQDVLYSELALEGLVLPENCRAIRQREGKEKHWENYLYIQSKKRLIK